MFRVATNYKLRYFWHRMARPQVADGETACIVKGSCEYIEYAVADSRQGVVLQLED
jgi:hypothetical protein